MAGRRLDALEGGGTSPPFQCIPGLRHNPSPSEQAGLGQGDQVAGWLPPWGWDQAGNSTCLSALMRHFTAAADVVGPVLALHRTAFGTATGVVVAHIEPAHFCCILLRPPFTGPRLKMEFHPAAPAGQ